MGDASVACIRSGRNGSNICLRTWHRKSRRHQPLESPPRAAWNPPLLKKFATIIVGKKSMKFSVFFIFICFTSVESGCMVSTIVIKENFFFNRNYNFVQQLERRKVFMCNSSLRWLWASCLFCFFFFLWYFVRCDQFNPCRWLFLSFDSFLFVSRFRFSLILFSFFFVVNFFFFFWWEHSLFLDEAIFFYFAQKKSFSYLFQYTLFLFQPWRRCWLSYEYVPANASLYLYCL